MPQLASTSLIFGCGYLGLRLAKRLVDRGQVVYATTRKTANLAPLAADGMRPLLLSITQPVTFASARPALEADSLDVYYLIPPGRPDQSPSPRQTVLGGVAHTLKQLRRTNLRRAVLTSSTAVYGHHNGLRVDAHTNPDPVDDRGRLLLAGEDLWRNAGKSYRIVRLAGLYGPGRIIGMAGVRQGAPLVGDPQALINLIHVDDAVELVMAVMMSENAEQVELACDGTPVPRIDYYRHLAQRIGVSPPPVLNDADAAAQLGLKRERLNRSSSKSLDNIGTCQRTGWTPNYPNFRVGLETALAKSKNQ